MDKTKAIYAPNPLSFPTKYVIDTEVCTGAECSKCVSACPYEAIDLSMTAESVHMKVGSVVMATGWKPYDATKLDNLGYGKYPNVITNVMMERMAATGNTFFKYRPKITVGNRTANPVNVWVAICRMVAGGL